MMKSFPNIFCQNNSAMLIISLFKTSKTLNHPYYHPIAFN